MNGVKYLNDLALSSIYGGKRPKGQLGYEGQPGNQGGGDNNNTNNSNNPPTT